MFATYDETELTDMARDTRASAEAIRRGLGQGDDRAAAVWGAYLCAIKPGATPGTKAWFISRYLDWKVSHA